MREDESYLSAALDASSVTLNDQSLIITPLECFKHGPSSNSKAAPDLVENICVNTKININLAGMKIGKASRGLFLVQEPKINISGNIKREFVGLNALRRQDREAALETLRKNPNKVALKIRRGIEPSTVAQKLSKYAK